MFIPKKTDPQQPPPPRGAAGKSLLDSFDVDLRKALDDTDVHELSFEEFHRALVQQGKLKHQ